MVVEEVIIGYVVLTGYYLAPNGYTENPRASHTIQWYHTDFRRNFKENSCVNHLWKINKFAEKINILAASVIQQFRPFPLPTKPNALRWVSTESKQFTCGWLLFCPRPSFFERRKSPLQGLKRRKGKCLLICVRPLTCHSEGRMVTPCCSAAANRWRMFICFETISQFGSIREMHPESSNWAMFTYDDDIWAADYFMIHTRGTVASGHRVCCKRQQNRPSCWSGAQSLVSISATSSPRFQQGQLFNANSINKVQRIRRILGTGRGLRLHSEEGVCSVSTVCSNSPEVIN